MKKNWIFGTNSFSGNPKWLYLYIEKYYPEVNLYWLADNKNSVNKLQRSHKNMKVIVSGTRAGDKILKKAEVYVEEQFREKYPTALNEDTIFLNLWHGVGLKDIELSYPFNGQLASSIMRKNLTYLDQHYRRTLFLTTSKAMYSHFSNQIITPSSQFIKSGYPRVEVPKILSEKMENLKNKSGLSDDTKVFMYAPTFRDWNVTGYLQTLIPDIDKLKDVIESSDSLFIFNLHPRMRTDVYYKNIRSKLENHKQFMFIDESSDIYEYFDQIDYTIIDYSSLFYDLMAAGADKFIRYIPDYEKYAGFRDDGMIDYLSKTYGKVVDNFDLLLKVIKNPNPKSMISKTKKKELMNYFFEYSEGEKTAESIINAVNDFVPQSSIELPHLYSYDVFDTLICREVGMPEGVFYMTREAIVSSGNKHNFSEYFIANYPALRKDAENDVRHYMHHTQIERNSDIREVTLELIFERMSDAHSLSAEQKKFLVDTEIACELDTVRPIKSRVDELFERRNQGDDIILISDMYLPKSIIQKMLIKCDKRFKDIELYTSGETGYQKTTGLLYQYIFFSRFKHSGWTHIGDNRHADNRIPRRYNIETDSCVFEKFNQYEDYIAKTIGTSDGFRIANLMRKFRQDNIDYINADEKDRHLLYYAYAHMGSYITPYIDWSLKDAAKKDIKTLYFISRDGNTLIESAQAIAAETKNSINLKLIYGSRKAFRTPSHIDKLDDSAFTGFGIFQSVKNFEDLKKQAQINNNQFEKFFPTLQELNKSTAYTADDVTRLREAAKYSNLYHKHMLKIAEDKRSLVAGYLKQEVNIKEDFAFVEFWGRGYTQDSLHRLLKYVGSKKETAMYYARCIYGNTEGSKRIRFTNHTRDLTFIESIFNQVPIKSVTDYTVDKNDKIIPIVEAKDGKIFDQLIRYSRLFAKDFAQLNLADDKLINHSLFVSAVEYFHGNPQDETVAKIFGSMDNSIAIGGIEAEYAPVISLKTSIVKPLKHIRQNTKSWEMSLTRSSEAAILAIRIKQLNERVGWKVKRQVRRLSKFGRR